MNKHVIGVPPNIRYIGEWEEFRLFDFPYIINKQITGCGFTEWAITSRHNVITISPRVKLLENKFDQHKDSLDIDSELDYRALYISSDTDPVIDYDKSLLPKPLTQKRAMLNDFAKIIEERRLAKEAEERAKVQSRIFRNKVKAFWKTCQEDPAMDQRQKYCKILVTYDSFRKVKEALTEEGVFDKFYVVVDEFQSIFVDARFKATTEMEFVNCLQSASKVCYVSATPMIENYLNQLPEFKDLPYLTLDWGLKQPERISRPNIISHSCTTMVKTACSIIDKYRNNSFRDKDGNVIKELLPDGSIKETISKEAVIYFNSVKNICDIIKKAKLKYSEVDILCANSSSNINKIRKAFKSAGNTGKAWSGPDKVPLEGEPRKMFTLCTRTVYLGADFYSDNARSFIFSDANVGCLAVDITLDLPQILGRQRLDSNPWKNSAEIYFNPINDDNKLSEKEFNKIVNDKMVNTGASVSLGEKSDLGKEREVYCGYITKSIPPDNYRENYAAIEHHEGKAPVIRMNKLVYLSDLRYYEISQLDYADRCTVRSKLFDIGMDKSTIDSDMLDISNTINNDLKNFKSQMSYLCTSLDDRDPKFIEAVLGLIPGYIANYYKVLGPDRCRANSYERKKLENELIAINSGKNVDVDTSVYSTYKVGDKISLADLKSGLSNLFISIGYISLNKVRAVDIENWFEVKKITISLGKKRINGFELIKKKK